jgi:hypothetical protein
MRIGPLLFGAISQTPKSRRNYHSCPVVMVVCDKSSSMGTDRDSKVLCAGGENAQYACEKRVIQGRLHRFRS